MAAPAAPEHPFRKEEIDLETVEEAFILLQVNKIG
jgi:hypothetical protein